MINLPPLWKIRREVRRIGSVPARGLRGALIEQPRQWVYDHRVEQLHRLHTGHGTLTERVAVLVLFQPNGVAPSVQLTLDHLAAEDWSVLVVSNAPLGKTDAAMLMERSALVLERPNVGYDFGGYRAGFRLLASIGHRPTRLILMNDSTWFPLREADDTLRRMEGLGAAMAGHIFKTEEGRGCDHLESHLLMFSPEALGHSALARFWRGYVMSDDRVATIWRGEKGLTQEMLRAGLEVEGLIDHDIFLARLRELDDVALLRVLKELTHHRTDAASQCAALAEAAVQGENWRADFLNWVDGVLANSRQHLVSATFVAPAMRLCGMGFLKKTRDRRFHLARAKILEMEDAGRIEPLHPAVRAEIAAAVDGWRSSSD
ncbi:rhamnan synthesis F family protein [Sediminimonas qiaohouensis]|uniref:rhamnan synthesis F family protein n=1 Tax=Sediminimonas qiaohouensis TaxID=552061 RepID=UPI0012ECD2E5|nr:rhamnan synthesis F family protein [Sediminimonas qiaohouensis]